MMPSRETITMLRMPLLVLLFTLLVAATAVLASLQYRESQTLVYNSANASLVQARSKLMTSQTDEKNLRAYGNNFRALVNRGLFNEQQRLNWFENLKQLSLEHRLISLEYDLAPQRSLSTATPPAPNIEILASPLKLKVIAAHEEDLFHFLNAIRKLPQGFYTIDACNINRAASTSRPTDLSISADCHMEWLTFKAKKLPASAS
jgi:hypothetical protein